MFCPQCGKELAPNAAFCSCGYQVPAAPPVAASPVYVVAAPLAVNTSGQGETAPLPPEIHGWSWAAFLWGWVWGIGNNVWIALLTFIPYLGFIMAVILGLKGKEWAWRNKHWNSVDSFNKTQHKWVVWWFILCFLPFIFIFIFAVIGAVNPKAALDHANSVRLQQITPSP